MPGKVPGEGHLRLRLFPEHESVSGPGSLLGSEAGPRDGISLADGGWCGEGFRLSWAKRAAARFRDKGEGVERCCSLRFCPRC